MMTPIGVILEVGQQWREVDPRFKRIVTVTSWNQINEKVQLNGRTWASLKRFNGKRGGYALQSNGASGPPLTAGQKQA